MRERVRELRGAGLGTTAIAKRLGVNKSTVVFHIRRLDLPVDSRFARRFDWNEIRTVYEAGLSARECRRRYGFSRAAWDDAVTRGDIVARDHRIPLEELLVCGRKTSRRHLKMRLVDAGLKENACEICGLTEWRGGPLAVQLHHRNGDGLDNRLENLEFLCPNCHSQTENWAGRNARRKMGPGPLDGSEAA
jgi:hypothetical protein